MFFTPAQVDFMRHLVLCLVAIGLVTYALVEITYRIAYWWEKRQRIKNARLPKPNIKTSIPRHETYSWWHEGRCRSFEKF